VQDESNKVSRRSFIKAATLVTAAVAILPHMPFSETIFREIDAHQAAKLQAMADQETAYVRGIAFDAVGMGGNLAQVYVKNGKIVRITSLDYTSQYTTDQIQPWSITARGTTFNPTLNSMIPPFSLAYKKRAYSPNRVMYPLKRVDWDPAGNRNTQNRGQSKYVRISWDEAVATVADEVNRIKATYGTSAIVIDNGPHGETKLIHAAHGNPGNLMNVLGGATMTSGSATSWEGWYWGAKHVWGMTRWVGLEAPQTNVIPDTMQNTDMVLFWGADPEAHTWGWGGQNVSEILFWFKQLGIKKIFISPDFNYAAAVHADKWIPVKPNTDIALHLAVAYTWITEGTYNADYVKANTVGFDEASLPTGAPAGGSFKNYVLGISDGVPKTPKWAEGICGVPSRTIKALARDWAAKKTSILHCNGGAMIRGAYAHEAARTEVLLLAMQGVGTPGVNQIKIIEALQESLPAPVFKPSVASIYPGNTIHPVGGFPINYWLQAVTNPPVFWYGPSRGPWSPLVDQFNKLMYPHPGQSEMHMIWSDEPCGIACMVNSNEIAQAYTNPKLEFFLVQSPWFENDCQFADMVLPVKTLFEVEDMGVSSEEGKGAFTVSYYMGQCIDAVGESLSDYEIVSKVADKLGVLAQYTGGKSPSDLLQAAFEFSGTSSYISFEDFKAKGYYVFPTDPKWADTTKYPTGISQFAASGTGLETPSGKIEFYSIGLMKNFPDDTERPPLPHYIADGPTHQESLFSPRAKQFPLLFISDHPKWRVHAEMEDISWLREIPTCKVTGPDGYKYEPVWINPVDAANRGIKQGDIVQVFNERGTVLGGAYVTERIMPGSVAQVHGAKYDPISVGKIDRGGSNNTIAPGHGLSANAPGECCSGFLVQVTKADMAGLAAQYPGAFARVYDPSTGSEYGSWVDTTPPTG
jgi:anaerobic selenocysteine-containing dehydrogenase